MIMINTLLSSGSELPFHLLSNSTTYTYGARAYTPALPIQTEVDFSMLALS